MENIRHVTIRTVSSLSLSKSKSFLQEQELQPPGSLDLWLLLLLGIAHGLVWTAVLQTQNFNSPPRADPFLEVETR